MWKNQTYYPRAKDVRYYSDSKLLLEFRKHNVGAMFRSFTEGKQHGIYLRALKKELEKRDLL